MHQPAPSGSANVATGGGQILLLSTEQRVYGFDLSETFRVAIGRHETNDLRFNSRNVSNYHAEILNEEHGLVIRDMGSTNGTFVNDERIRQGRIRDGDLLRVGKYEIGVRLSGGANSNGSGERAPQFAEGTQGMFQQTAGPVPVTPDGKSDSLRDALNQIVASGRSFVVWLYGAGEEIQVYVHEGKIIHAQGDEVAGEKALYRAFSWIKGTFRLDNFPPNAAVPRSISLPASTIIEDGAQQASEMLELRGKLPAPITQLRLREDSKTRICDLSPAEVDVFQSLIRGRCMEAAMQESVLTDVRVMRATLSLLRKKVFDVEGNSGLLEQTSILTKP